MLCICKKKSTMPSAQSHCTLSHQWYYTHKCIQVLCNLCILWTCRKVSCPAPSYTAPKSHIDCKGKSDKIYMKWKVRSGILFTLCLSLFFPMHLCLLFLPYLCSLLVTRYSAYRQALDWVGHSRDKISKRKIRKMFLIIFFFGNVSRGYTNVSWPQICETDTHWLLEMWKLHV